MAESDARPTLASQYDGLVCDLDGVVYRGPDEVPGAVAALNAAMASGLAITFATNNASRPPETVADHLRELGVDGPGWSVVTSSQAAAAYIARTVPPGSHVLAVGGPGVHDALREAGLTPVRVADLAEGADAAPLVAVMQGLGMDVTWTELAEVAFRTDAGLPWVAANLDIMLPTGRGPAPGNGALVAAVRTATRAVPHVVGKPAPDLYNLCRDRLGCTPARTLACGDRLDTDIEGANAAGLDSLLVFTGAATLQEVAFAPKQIRPTHVAPDVRGLGAAVPRIADLPRDLVSALVSCADGVLTVSAAAPPEVVLPAVVAAAWAALDDGDPLSAEPAMWQALASRAGLGARPVRR